MTCDRCVGLSFIDRFHLACLSRDEEVGPPFGVRVKFFFFFKNFLLSTSFVLQK